MADNNQYLASHFVYGYSRFLDSNWYQYDYNPYGFFNNTPGLFGLSNYALQLSIINSITMILSQLEGTETTENNREEVLEKADHCIHNHHQPHRIAEDLKVI